MARRRRKGGSKGNGNGLPIHVLFKLMGVLVLLITFLLSSALIGAWVYFEFSIREFKGKYRRADFRLSAEEKERLDKALELRGRVERRLQKIREMREVLPLRMDGAFDGRNREGRQLNEELQKLREHHERCSVVIDDISTREQRRFGHCATIRGGLFASRLAMALIPLLVVVMCMWTPASVVALSSFIEGQTGLAPLAGVEALYGMLVAAAWAAFAAFLVIWAIGRFLLVLAGEAE